MASAEPRKILVIDDSEVTLTHIKRALVGAGYDVVTTTQVVGNARYLPTCDLVLLDFHMPGLDGSAVVGSMRSIATSMKRTCPIFLYTSDVVIACRYKELGFDGVFSSKGDEQALVRQVASLFRMADMQAAKAARITGLPSASR
jgi:CheY-like chemotaxis protein